VTVLVSMAVKLVAGFLRRTWLVTLVAIAICGMFAARGIAAYREANRELAPAPVHVAMSSPLPAPTKPERGELVRDIFCSSCEPGPPPPESYEGHPAVLIATTLGGGTSRATVRVVPTEVQGSWAEGEVIPGVGRITRIGGTSIDVTDRSGRSKQLSLREAVAGTGAATPTPATVARAPGITQLSDGSFEVSRDVVRELVASGGRDAGARAQPVLEQGEIKGLRFFGVRPTSSAAAIGIRSGDTLSAIDGAPIKTAQQLLDLYGKLDRLAGLELQGTRGGKPLAIQLRFR
jgi:hypothetical protein